MEKCIDQDCIMHDHLCEFDCAMSNEDMNICEDYKCLTTQKDAMVDVTCNVGLDDMLEVVKEIRKSDCGAWLKDCTGSGIFNCSQGAEKRQELSRLLNKLYKASGI